MNAYKRKTSLEMLLENIFKMYAFSCSSFSTRSIDIKIFNPTLVFKTATLEVMQLDKIEIFRFGNTYKIAPRVNFACIKWRMLHSIESKINYRIMSYNNATK